MRKRTILAVVFGLLALSWANEAAAYPTDKLTRNELKIACEQAGGVFGDAVLGVYYCFFPDGSVIICSGSTGKCDYREPRRGEFQKFLSTILATQGKILETQQKVVVDLGGILTDLGNIQSKMDDLHSACAPADLLPVPMEGVSPPDYCRLGDSGLIVKVKNQGFMDAGPFAVRVTFTTPAGPVPVDYTVNFLPWGPAGVIDIPFSVPPACFEVAGDPQHLGACNFQIAVDSGSVVAESSEANNIANGVCLPLL